MNDNTWEQIRRLKMKPVERTSGQLHYNDPDFAAMTDNEWDLWSNKGREYVNGGDRLANFNRVAQSLGVTPLQVWAVYAAKHWMAIMEYIRSGREGAEGIESRLADLAVYAKLARLLVREARK